MGEISDDFLLAELKNRFLFNSETIQEQRQLVAELEKVNQRLVESERIQSAFLSNIRNEVNNPLTSILGLSRDMMFTTGNINQLKKSATLVFSEAFRLSLQMQNIFVAAELEAGQAQPYIMNVNVKSLIEITLENFKHLIERKGLSIDLISDMGGKTFQSDPEKLKTILSNLIMNAVEFSRDKGKIIIVLSRYTEGDLLISVKDDGEGIPVEKLETIFDRFVQLNTGTTKTHQGHGLGLSVVKSLVEFMNGKIEVRSKVGEGSNFVVAIPESISNSTLNGLSDDGNEFIFDSDDSIVA
jgi:signal transduction histidine kinase